MKRRFQRATLVGLAGAALFAASHAPWSTLTGKGSLGAATCLVLALLINGEVD